MNQVLVKLYTYIQMSLFPCEHDVKEGDKVGPVSALGLSVCLCAFIFALRSIEQLVNWTCAGNDNSP